MDRISKKKKLKTEKTDCKTNYLPNILDIAVQKIGKVLLFC